MTTQGANDTTSYLSLFEQYTISDESRLNCFRLELLTVHLAYYLLSILCLYLCLFLPKRNWNGYFFCVWFVQMKTLLSMIHWKGNCRLCTRWVEYVSRSNTFHIGKQYVHIVQKRSQKFYVDVNFCCDFPFITTFQFYLSHSIHTLIACLLFLLIKIYRLYLG